MVFAFPKATAKMGQKYKIYEETSSNYAIICKPLVKYEPLLDFCGQNRGGSGKNPRKVWWGGWVVKAPILGFFPRIKYQLFTHFFLLFLPFLAFSHQILRHLAKQELH